MVHRLVFCCMALASSLCLAVEGAAQSPQPVTAEGSIGFRVGHGGSYHSRGGAVLDLVLVSRLRDSAVGTWIGGAAVGAQTSALAGDLVCLLLPDGSCAPDFPPLVSVAALAGVQRGSLRTASARLLVGPTYHQALSGREFGGAVGLQGRLDVATPPWREMAAVASLRHSLLPSFRGEAVGITSFGVGVRIQ